MKTKKIFLVWSVLFLISTLNFTSLYAQWEECNNGIGVNTPVCFFVDGNNTYAGTSSGIFVTTDYGDNWTDKNSGFKLRYPPAIWSLAKSDNNIFAGTLLYGIFLSTDKGENWVQKSNGLPYIDMGLDTIFPEEVYALMINNNYIFAGTQNGVYLSTDNGDNWIFKNNGLPQFDTNKREVFSLAVSGNNIFAGTRYGVYMTSDNGDNWFFKSKGLENLTFYSFAISGNNIYAATCFGGIFLSTNNGNDWVNIGRKDTCIDEILIKDKYIFASGGFYISSDNGINWSTYENGLKDFAIVSLILNGDYIFAGDGDYGVYRAKLSDLGITDVKETNQNNETIIYPNPASSSFNLKYESPSYSKLQISIFDMLGNEVFNTSEDCNIGMNEKIIDCQSLETGYYIVRLKQGERVEAKPLVIVRN
ncbi:MAG: T9SS type A sorting domain-containing protein [FCB group bacterium]|jgi:photosystem II stability/assembly factor-like uncharacterized protein